MGTNSSKTNQEITAAKKDVDGGNSDPRSPTPEITRTPLQNKQGSKHNITKNVDLRKTFESANGEEKLIHNNPILSAVIKNHLQSFDPRSPTQDFARTPIVIGVKNDSSDDVDNCASPQLKSDIETCDSCSEAVELSPDGVVPKNLCNGFYDLSLNDEPLGSSTASNDAIDTNMTNCTEEKPTLFLETNFDYVEPEDKFEDSKEDQNEIDFDNNKVENVPVYKILDIDPRSPSIGIERTPIVIAKTEVENSDGNVEDMSDDSLIKVLQNTNAELRQTVNTATKNSEGLLIYEDEAANLHDTPKKSKSIGNSGARTPLSCMKNKDANHARSKSVNTLYDPKDQKSSKIPKRVSHIPRLKSLSNHAKIASGSSVSLKNISKASSIGGDCENTPPHTHRDRWDKDSSIVL